MKKKKKLILIIISSIGALLILTGILIAVISNKRKEDSIVIKFTRDTVFIDVDEKFYNNLVDIYSDNDLGIKYYSSNDQIVSVDEYGNILGVSPGKTRIFAEYKKQKVSYEVTVRTPAIDETEPVITNSVIEEEPEKPKEPINYKMTLSHNSVEILNGKTTVVRANITPDDGVNKVTWTTDNKKIASVTNGVIKGLHPGVATITATTDFAKLSVTVKVLTGHNEIDRYESKSLKYFVDDYGGFALTHIWVEDAYNQLKTTMYQKSSPGVVKSGKDILEETIKRDKLTAKGMVGTNASGITSIQFSQYLYEAYPEWKDSIQSPILIMDGKVLRNLTDKPLPDKTEHKIITKTNSFAQLTYGLSKDGNLKSYNFKTGDNEDAINFNKEQSTNIINDEIKYTFSFHPVLVENSQLAVSESNTAVALRSVMCQIDKENFILLNTVGNKKDGKQYDLHVLGTYMKNYGCTTAFNLDGGGSVTAYYKKNDNKLKKIADVESRKLSDMLIFVEK